MENDDFLNDLDDLLSNGDFKKVDSIIDNFVPIDFSEEEISRTLKLIRNKRKFGTLEKAATAFIAQDHQFPIIKKQLSQALIEQDRLDQAIGVLTTTDKKMDWSEPEKPEIIGLIGRAKKQKFVKTGDPESLRQSLDAYQQGWDNKKGDYRWLGINLVALKERGTRDKIDGVGNSDVSDIANTILKEINELESPQVWDYGTAMEASLALGDKNSTMIWAKKYVKHPDIDAFELGSTLRQLREIWQVNDNQIANSLEPVLEYEILHHKGGAVSITPDEISDSEGFEAIYGSESYIQITWLKSMFSRLKSVARIAHKTTGEPQGTGFLIKGSDMNPEWSDELLLVTNSHVVSDDPSDHAPLRPDMAIAEFTQLPGRPKIDLGKKVFHSSRNFLDAWICEIPSIEGLAALDLSFYAPLVADEGDKPQRVYVIGHPKGGDLVVSLYNNDLVGYELPYVHYTSPTEGGSSGSPVLSRDLETFALHHKTKKALKANEGILLDEIRDQSQGKT